MRKRKRSVAKEIAYLARRLSGVGELGAQLGVPAEGPCWLTPSVDEARKVRLKIAEYFLGRRPKRAQVCHRCDDGRCINPAHFFWGTASDNAVDRQLKGRHPWGLASRKTLEQRLLKLASQLAGQLSSTPSGATSAAQRERSQI